MVGIVIVSHENLASALLATAEGIAGKQEQAAALGLASGESMAGLQLRIDRAVQQVDSGNGVLLLADVIGGSPYQAAAMAVMQETEVELVAGVNLPMLLEILPNRKKQRLAAVTEMAVRSGNQGIGTFIKFKMP